MGDTAWLATIKTGDKVVTRSGSFDITPEILLVHRTTATLVVTVGDRKWYLKDGREVGQRFGHQIEPYTPQIEAELELIQLRRKGSDAIDILRAELRYMGAEKIRSIIAIAIDAKEQTP